MKHIYNPSKLNIKQLLIKLIISSVNSLLNQLLGRNTFGVLNKPFFTRNEELHNDFGFVFDSFLKSMKVVNGELLTKKSGE